MKKYYTTPEYKRRQRILHEGRLEAARARSSSYRGKRWGAILGNSASARRKLNKSQSGVLKGRDLIVAPADFRVKENCDEMLRFFSDVYRCVRDNRRLFFDMSGIVRISADAILYMLSTFQFYLEFNGYSHIAGNYPSDPACRQLLIESGFLDYVKSSSSIGRKSGGLLSVKSDNLVQGGIALEVVEFAKEKLGSGDHLRPRNIYSTLIECMANTKHHAYEQPFASRKWWLMALPSDDGKRVHFAFLDNGMGIPSTIRRDYRERVHDLLGKGISHGDLIHSALVGQFRTRTGNTWRGKGLPKINSYAQEGAIKNLTVISGNGFVDTSNGLKAHMLRKFHGTLLSWDFV